jgi:hypothetical protein
MKKIAHRVNEDHPGRSPAKRIAELFRHNPQIKAKLEWMAGDAAPTLGERFGVTVETTGADFGAAANWIPSSDRPFDF